MTSPEMFNSSINKESSGKIFIYEVVNLPQNQKTNELAYSIRPKGRVFIRVPYNRMNQEMRRINRSGGKIISIQMLNEVNTQDIAEFQIPQGNGYYKTESTNTQESNDITSEYAWWLEIFTQEPKCTYYFGPFEKLDEAVSAQGGYLEDLKEEGATGISLQVKWCKPTALTIF